MCSSHATQRPAWCMWAVGCGGRGSAGGGVAVAMGGVWVTSEATALIDATVTAVAGVQFSVWRKRSGATDFWRADADFLWLGRCAMA